MTGTYDSGATHRPLRDTIFDGIFDFIKCAGLDDLHVLGPSTKPDKFSYPSFRN